MRNLTDEQAESIAFTIIGDHLDAGIEFLTIGETVDESLEEDEEATDEDYQQVASYVDEMVKRLRAFVDQDDF